jgi:hypothetical protein
MYVSVLTEMEKHGSLPHIQDTLSQVISNGAYSPGDMVSFQVDQSVGGNEPNA